MRTDVMLWRDGRWVRSTMTELPPHSHGKAIDCDRCNAELYRDLQRAAARGATAAGTASRRSHDN
jgi:hypothetical protein